MKDPPEIRGNHTWHLNRMIPLDRWEIPERKVDITQKNTKEFTENKRSSGTYNIVGYKLYVYVFVEKHLESLYKVVKQKHIIKIKIILKGV